MYLNTIYYGNSAYGIEAAAQTYFDKSAAELNLAESALLAGIPRNPSYYSPFVNKEAALARQKTVLALMHKEGYISRQEMEEAAAATLEFCEPSQEEDYCAYFVDYIINGEIKERLGGSDPPLPGRPKDLYHPGSPAAEGGPGNCRPDPRTAPGPGE